MEGTTILDAVKDALTAAREEPVYPTKVQQNIERPCFLVESVLNTNSKVSKDTFRFTEHLQVTWVPSATSKQPEQECLRTGLDLCEILAELPTKPRPVRTLNPEYEVIEGELIFSADVVYRASLAG